MPRDTRKLLIKPFWVFKSASQSRAITVQEIKWGRMTIDWVTFLKYRFPISDRAMAIRIEVMVLDAINRTFKKKVLNVTRKKASEPKNALKLYPFASP